ncbi:MAG TPA: beta-N-acetylhexosaminidase [Pelobium sp.]|nr:beta-N-acetylhexosaminidase [Pelobium sp.]
MIKNILTKPIRFWIFIGLFFYFSSGYGQIKGENYNSFKVKGFHLDLRVQVMKMPALKAFAKRLSENGINTLVMEWEATYPYQKHSVISNQYAYSREEIKSFVAYCSSINIDVIPLQQSFGHVEYILKHYRYKHLREDQKDYSQVNPLKEEECKTLFKDLYSDLISTHTSQYIHIGGDETYLLGHSEASKKKIAEVGKGRLYGDYLKMLCDLVVSLGKRPVVWADIALNYPDALNELPKETVLVDWNYGWDLNRFGDHDKLMKSGYEIWGSPAIRSNPDNYFLTDWNKHFRNIRTFIPQARELGYDGMVMTSWSTSGIYSPVFETHSDIIALPAIRRVYPISGFNMLIEAYFEALKSKQPLVIENFVTQYAAEKYGFDRMQSDIFWKALKTTPYEVNQGEISKPSLAIKDLRDSAVTVARQLKSLKPSKNKDEFKHYQLMADIRVYYLTCVSVESEMNKTAYKASNAKDLLVILNQLNPKELNKRFKRLNKDLLNISEISTENELRNARFDQLKTLLTHQL